ncbi:MAG: LacI family DNA-binding transcriptional regulator [Clostridiales bacterium]|nr:LacI family DNA-binding transcriptional regulator [Clostridiales bacterium]MDY3747821.1 LacI family DNA-binding transcriptional regulator [Lachnospiraceae bacterium]
MTRKKVTMKDIAEKLNLSINAVSLALNDRAGVGEETRRLILNTAEEMGYLDQSAKYVQTYSNKNICVLLEHRFFRDFRFYGRVLLGIEEQAKKSGYDVFVNSFEVENVPSCVENHKVSGIIVVGKISASFLTKLKTYHLPVVLADYTSLEEPTDCVMSDNKQGAYKMTSYLIEKGFRRIGYMGDLDYSPSTRERFFGYHEAIQNKLGFKDFDESLKYVQRFSCISDVENAVINQDMEKLYERFLDIQERPEVIFCSNDHLAFLLLKVLQKKGFSIPEDIGIVGFDDVEMSHMVYPALTTVNVRKKKMGENATKRLLYRIAHPKEEVQMLVMNVEIVERDSVCMAKNI